MLNGCLSFSDCECRKYLGTILSSCLQLGWCSQNNSHAKKIPSLRHVIKLFFNIVLHTIWALPTGMLSPSAARSHFNLNLLLSPLAILVRKLIKTREASLDRNSSGIKMEKNNDNEVKRLKHPSDDLTIANGCTRNMYYEL